MSQIQPIQMQTALNSLESWDKLGIEGRAKALRVTISALEPHLSAMAEWQVSNALHHIAERKQMPGPTGERNELFCQGRGVILCTTDLDGEALTLPPATQVALAGQIYAALIAGNAVITVGPFGETLTDLINASVPMGVVQNVAGSAQDSFIDSEHLAGVAITTSEDKIRQLNARLAGKNGLICQLISESDVEQLPTISNPAYILRFITERTVTTNTTAVGGNASLLALGSKDD